MFVKQIKKRNKNADKQYMAISVRPCHSFRSNSATLKDAVII